MKRPHEYNKKFDNILAKAKEMGYNNIAFAMTCEQFREYVRGVKCKRWRFEPNKNYID